MCWICDLIASSTSILGLNSVEPIWVCCWFWILGSCNKQHYQDTFSIWSSPFQMLLKLAYDFKELSYLRKEPDNSLVIRAFITLWQFHWNTLCLRFRFRCKPEMCRLCYSCMTTSDKETYQQAYLEHVNRYNTKRVMPQLLVSHHKGIIFVSQNILTFEAVLL